MITQRLVRWMTVCLSVLALSGCDFWGSSTSAGVGSNDSITVTSSVQGTVAAKVGSAGQTVAITFNSSDSKPISNLTVVSGLDALPAGWTAPGTTFFCSTVTTGSGCVLTLTYAPTAIASGTFTLYYNYIDNGGFSKTANYTITYASTASNNVVATAAPAGQINAVVGAASQAVTVTFDTDDGNAATAFLMSISPGTLPNGWSTTTPEVTCDSVSTGNGCQVVLTYAPTVVNSGTIALTYAYTDDGGTRKNGTLSIPFASTAHDSIVGKASPTGQINAVVGAGSQTVTVNFNTDDGNAATAFNLTTNLATLPTGWHSGAGTLACATVSTGNGCQLVLTYTPAGVTSGTILLAYTYTDNAGNGRVGTVSIPYASTAHDNVMGTASPTGQISAVVGGGAHAVTVTFATDDGNAATALTLTTALNSLPAGWSSTSSSFACSSVSTGNGCQLALSYTPTAIANGTLMLNYGYSDNAGTAKTGSVSIPYQATTHNNIVATAAPSGTLTVNVFDSHAVTLTFTTDDTNVATAFSVTTNLTALPAGWSANSSPFSCASVTTGTSCQLSLTYAPTAAVASSTLSIAYGYNDNSGTAKTGTASIVYVAHAQLMYVTDSGNAQVSTCAIAGTGGLSGCVTAGSGPPGGFQTPIDLTFHGTSAYVADFAGVDVCAVNSDGTLANCVVAPSTTSLPYRLDINGSWLYYSNQSVVGGPVVCAIQTDGSLGACNAANTATFGAIQTTAVAFAGGFAYVGTNGSGAGIYVCTPNSSDGTLSGCVDSTSGQNSNVNIAVVGSTVYAIAQAVLSECSITAGTGALACASETISLPGVTNLQLFGGLVFFHGHVYMSYKDLIAGTGGVLICTVDSTGTVAAACTDAGSTGLAQPTGLALH